MIQPYVEPPAPGVDRSVTNASVLAADKLSVRFQGLAAIADVSLAVQRHEVFGLIGPNGAGKTTLVNCLTGFQKPSEGRITLGGTDTAGWPASQFRERGVARTFQAGRLFKDMTVAENVEVTATGLGLGLRHAREHALEHEHHENTDESEGGEEQAQFAQGGAQHRRGNFRAELVECQQAGNADDQQYQHLQHALALVALPPHHHHREKRTGDGEEQRIVQGGWQIHGGVVGATGRESVA